MNEYEFDELKQYENYDVDPVSPYALLQKMNAWNKEVRITVTDLDNRTQASIAVLEGEISLRVLADEIIQSINLSQEGLKIDVTKMDISGLVTISAIGQSGTTMIHGGNIITDTILADRLAVDELSAITANLGTINAGTINGIQINSANISVQEDVEVGQFLTIGKGFDTASKGILFKGTAAYIDVFGDSLRLNGSAIIFNGTVSGLYARFG